MPTPTKEELNGGEAGEKKFVSRCVAVVKREQPGISNKAAAGKCYGMFRNAKGVKSGSTQDSSTA